MEVKNKVCIVTGSAQGLGKSFAKILLNNEARVCLADLKPDSSRKTLEEFENQYGAKNVCFCQCDVTKENEFESLFDKTEQYFGVPCIDILVNNAGVYENYGWRKCMEVNIIGVMVGTSIALRRMKISQKKGQIINTASLAGLITGMGESMIGYSASKHGVVAMTRTLSRDFNEHGVSIKAICPAFADTDMVSAVLEHSEGRVKDEVTQAIRSNGLMTPDYVAEGFYKLVTECSNGDIIWSMPDTPYLVIPDDGEMKLIMLVLLAKAVGKITGNDLITLPQQRLFIFGLILFSVFIARFVI